MVGIVPSPGNAVFVVIRIHPAQPFNVGLLYLLTKFLGLCFALNLEFFMIISLLPASSSELNPVHVLTCDLLTFFLELLADDGLDVLISQTLLFIFTHVSLLEYIFHQELLLIILELLGTEDLLFFV